MTLELAPDRVLQQQDDGLWWWLGFGLLRRKGAAAPLLTPSQLGAERTDGKYDEATISSVTTPSPPRQRLCLCVLAVLLCFVLFKMMK